MTSGHSGQDLITSNCLLTSEQVSKAFVTERNEHF